MAVRSLPLSVTLRVVVLVAALPALAAAQTNGWIKAGSSPADYEAGVDSKNAFTGTSSGFIRSATATPTVFGTYMQTIDAAEYRGKRVRMSAQVKTENVQQWAAMWMRVDVGPGKVSAFDNMENRSIKGSTPWTPVSIVLDVDPKAAAVAFGILVAGRGAAWLDDLNFEIVGPDVPVTTMITSDGTPVPPTQPRNLDFENAPQR